MKKRVLLLAVSCKTGGLCPGGIDLDNPRQWIRIVKDDGNAGAIQGREIDFAEPLDVIEFDGTPMPMGKQRENWVINNNSCRNLGHAISVGRRTERELLDWAYNNYGYHGYWGNYNSYLNEDEFDFVSAPSETILKVTNVRIYRNNYNRAKIDFDWSGAMHRLLGVSMTDQDFYDRINDGDVTFRDAYIIISIPKKCDWIDPNTGEGKAYKFVSRIFRI